MDFLFNIKAFEDHEKQTNKKSIKIIIRKKYGGYLLSEAIKICFKIGSNRVWVHTCSLDHKYALKNYQARGMKIFKSETVNLNIN